MGWDEVINCYYDDKVPTLNVTYIPHSEWGNLVLGPFLLNYFLCWYMWWTTDENKKVTWLAPLFSFYPQLIALKIIRQIRINPERGFRERKLMYRNVIQKKTFCEAVPNTLVLTYMLLRALKDSTEGREIIFDMYKSSDSNWFWVSLSSSALSSAFGLARNLDDGPCRILQVQTWAPCRPRFLLLIFAFGLTLIGKGVAVASAIPTGGPCGEEVPGGALIAFSTLFLPGFFVGLFACWHRNILCTFLAHPSVFLLPVYSYFTFASDSKLCCRGGERATSGQLSSNSRAESISFSPKYTAVNVGVSLAGIIAFFCIQPRFITSNPEFQAPFDTNCGTEIYLVYGLPFSILGLTLTLAATFCKQKGSRSYSSGSCSCFCSFSWCDCCFEPTEFAALKISDPNTPYIVGEDGVLIQERDTQMGNFWCCGLSTPTTSSVLSRSVPSMDTTSLANIALSV